MARFQSFKTLCLELGWESLSERRWSRRILQIHNNNNTFHDIRCRSSRYMSSFFPDAISSWNNVITHFDNIPSINNLKNHLVSLIRPMKKNIFGIHDPVGLRYLLQLRVGLCLLRNHKKRHDFIDTPSDKCLCNHGNDFLFSCPFFADQRVTLANSIIQILQKYSLNGLGNHSRL